MIAADWTPHRREDGELVGWIRPEGDAWVAVDLLGRPASEPVEWLDAEEALEERGLAWLTDIWMLERVDDSPLRVRVAEVTPGGADEPGTVVVHTDDFGAIDVPYERTVLPWPPPPTLRPRRADDPDGRLFG
jgi:hypothetical protein